MRSRNTANADSRMRRTDSGDASSRCYRIGCRDGELTMKVLRVMAVGTLTTLALVAVSVLISTSALADDTDAPSWLIPNTTYAGVWKTVGANSAPDLDS